ncbi:hypothetical protein [Streptomyces chrestomyceticus]|uniref:Uncharacterized protein n=1 Tax=Streptomyces chrestomyceticus TaxID=68185 RepID=A0ABU7WMN5_9ACTN
MEYRDIAYGYVSALGFIQLQWDPAGRVRATQVFTGETAVTCEGCDEPIPDDAEPDEVLRRLARCHDQKLFGVWDWWVFATWGTDSMYRRARHGADLRLTADELLAVLLLAARHDSVRLDVRHYEGPRAWDAQLWTARPDSPTSWFGPVAVDAGLARTLLRAAEHLMPSGTATATASTAELLGYLLSTDRETVAYGLDNLSESDAYEIFCFGVLGYDPANPSGVLLHPDLFIQRGNRQRSTFRAD